MLIAASVENFTKTFSYLDLGIEINYLSFLRGAKSQTAKKLSTAWCSEDQNTLTDLKLGKELPLKNLLKSYRRPL